MNIAFIPYQRRTVRRVPVKTLPGLSKMLGAELAALNISSAFVVYDARLGDDLVDALGSSLSDAGIRFSSRAVRAAEELKSMGTLAALADSSVAERYNSTTAVVALGGGVIGNLAGLMASLLYRGLPLVHVPTTLLAQLDSAVDVKQSVNCGTQKNSFGALYPPTLVLCDPEVLASLDRRDRISGLGEAIKHGFAQDIAFARFVSSGDVDSLSFLQEVITKTVALKQRYWESASGLWKDGDTQVRLTHLGHAVGKILEMHPQGALAQGEAISHGMVVEGRLAHELGYLSGSEATEMERLIQAAGLLQHRWTPDISAIIGELEARGALQEALLERFGAGRVVSQSVDSDLVIRALTAYLDKSNSVVRVQIDGTSSE